MRGERFRQGDLGWISGNGRRVHGEREEREKKNQKIPVLTLGGCCSEWMSLGYEISERERERERPKGEGKV